jgi:hypothetical protein
VGPTCPAVEGSNIIMSLLKKLKVMTLNIESKILSFLNLEKKNLQETHLTLFIYTI